MLRGMTPMLAVRSAARSRDFYCGTLGFECVGSFESEGRLAWCHLVAGGRAPGRDGMWRTELMVTTSEGGADRDTRRGVILYFYPDDVPALHAELKASGCAVGDMRVTFYRMKEFELEDPDGYQLWFGQDTDEPPTECEE